MAAQVVQKSTHYDWTKPPICISFGVEKQTFWLNAASLTRNSKFFEKALSENWSPQEKSFEFCEDGFNGYTFNTYANWCMHNDIDQIFGTLEEEWAGKEHACGYLFHKLTELYILANFLDDKTLLNAIMDKTIELAVKFSAGPAPCTITLVFSNLLLSSAMCRFFIDCSLAKTNLNWLQDQKKSLPQDYLEALLFGWAKAAQDKTTVLEHPSETIKVATCTYHEHDDDVPRKGACLVVPEPEEATTEAPASERKKLKRTFRARRL